MATWTIISQTGLAGAGPGPGGGAAPPVTITTFTVTVRSNTTWEVAVYYTPSPSANAQNYSGVAIYLEDPDISFAPPTDLSGNTRLDGSRQTSGRWIPEFENNSYQSPADFIVGVKSNAGQTYKAGRNVRVYLASFGPNSQPNLVRANQPNPTPNVVIPIPAPGSQYARGEEYAWLVTNAQVVLQEDFNRTDPQYRMEFSYTPPDPSIPLPPGMNPFGGVEIFYTYPDSANTDPLATITDSGIFVPETSAEGYLSPVYSPGGGGTFRVYFCSGDNSQPAHVNSLIPGVTPYVQVTIVYPPSGSGGPSTTPDITNLTLVSSGLIWNPDGTLWAEAVLTWTPPANPSFAGVLFYKTAVNGSPVAPQPLLGQSGNLGTTITLLVQNYPNTAQDWTITAISEDANGKMNNDPANPHANSPQVIWRIGPPGPGGTGQEYASLVNASGVSIVTDQQVSNDGVQMMRFTISGWTDPTGDNKFQGVKIALVDNVGTTYWDAGMTTSITTPWQPAVSAQPLTFYFLSYSAQNQINSILPGLTPSKTIQFTPTPGQIKASQIPNNWWNTAEFAWPTWPQPGGFQANVIAAGKIAVGSVLRVGGAPSTSPFAPSFQGQNGQIAVYSSGTDPGDSNGTPTLRAWLGQQTTSLPGGAFGTVYGGWLSELYVGGNGPPTSPLYVRNGGVMILGGWDVQSALGTTYFPYLSIRDKFNTERGRVGASLAANPDGSRIVPVGDIADIGGAWFTQFATGGVNLADWRLLCPGDNTIRIRNVNNFEIDYLVNTAPAPPFNQPYRLQLGTDVAYAASMGGYKFPGITLMRRLNDANQTVTAHGMSLINRGLVLTADQVSGQTLRATLVTFNGDGNGGDADPFWGELDLYSPTTGRQNVRLTSGDLLNGAVTGASSLTMTDDFGNISFQVRPQRDVLIGNQLLWGPSATAVIDNTGAWVGAVKASSLSAANLSFTGLFGSSPYGVIMDPSGNATFNSISMGTAGGGGSHVSTINSSGQFVGPGGVNTSGSIIASSIAATNGVGAAYFQSQGQTGVTQNFAFIGTDNNHYTVHVVGGIITAITFGG